MEHSLLLIDQRAEETKKKLPFIDSKTFDLAALRLKNKMLMLLVIEGVRLN